MRLSLLAVLLPGLGCSSVQTVRLQPETVDVGPGMRPIAGIQAEVSTFSFLGIQIPGDITLDRVVNRMLIVTAKTMGADKITGLRFSVDCPSMCWSRVFGFPGARASGIAVQLTSAPPDPAADEGPEAPAPR